MAINKREWTNAKGVQQEAWLADYKDQSGKRRYKQFAKKKDAEAFLNNARHEVAQGTHTADRASVTVSEAADLWIKKIKAKGRERSTWQAYQGWKVHHIDPLIGGEKLSRLTMPRVERFALDLLENGRSYAMAHRVLNGLKMLITSAQKAGLVNQNVALGVKVERPKRQTKKKVRIPERDEVRAILDAAAEYYPGWRAMLLTAVVTGMRISELRGLRWTNIDLKAGAVTVEERADNYRQMGDCKSGAGYRTIPIAAEVVVVLKEWKLACPKGTGEEALGLAFPNTEGGIVHYSNFVNRVWNPLQRKAGIAKPYGFHGLRHFAASAWIARKIDLKRLTTWLGHASVQQTLDTYGHLMTDPETDEAIAAGTVAGLL